MKKINNIKESVFIKDGLNQSYIFYKDDNQNLIFNRANIDNSPTIIDKNILDFSATIDENNSLHLLYLNRKGELIYCTYPGKTWHKNLVSRLDIQSNIYKYLSLILHKNTINIFYASANIINLNLWTIEHFANNIDTWQKYIVTNIFSEKIIDRFYIDKDEFGNIYIVYSGKEYANYNIYYLYFNNFTKKWATTPTKISSSYSNNILPYIFVDSHNNVHILWYISNNEDYVLKYKRFSSTGDNKFQWEEIKLPKISGHCSQALMFEKNGKLNIVYISNEEMFNFISNDYGNTWTLEDKNSITQYPIYLIKYYNLSLNRVHSKINHIYGNMNDYIISFYFDNSHEDIIDSNMSQTNNLNDENININSNQKESKFVTNIDMGELEKLKNTLAEMQSKVKAIKNDIQLIKDRLTDIEENSKNKIGFLKIKK
ncbi:hypothetical protein [Tepidimicrobium xylanilyticum]|uniref:BNR repeat-containing family member n=1 Tax=Tepidimicrobium xylanilyticum TaxID=1123352 RepID=A0A1H2SK94_9FIRM|nr:hypothetical protein [Tepidimicrobium xylanilyticum]GMG96192.1 hypothetical protein EN5CB1_10180 [Tepidimicrobium xylanilyticum]SDW32002.1 hypothetical protein SAMN05660923_00472 [Tepidimicrobium xylanilyticum]